MWKYKTLEHPAYNSATEVLLPEYPLFCCANIHGKQKITSMLSCVQVQSLEKHKEWQHSQRRMMQKHGDHLVFSHNSAKQSATEVEGWENITPRVLLLLGVARDKAVLSSVSEAITDLFLTKTSRHNAPGENNSNHPFYKMTDKTTVQWSWHASGLGYDGEGRDEQLLSDKMPDVGCQQNNANYR